MFRSEHQPLCRNCGKPIAKHTESVYPTGTRNEDSGLYSKADCQKGRNDIVVSIEFSYETNDYFERTGHRWVSRFTVWDGETYIDQFFHNGECARKMGYLYARGGQATRAYNEALAKQQESL